jgi:uncharacterized phage protein (TIGR02218 family)
VKPHSAGLIALLATNQFYLAELWKIVLADGTVLKYCGGDTAIGSYLKTGIKIGREGAKGKLRQTLGLEVGTLDFEIFADPADTTAYIEGIPALAFIRGGGLDGASVQLDAAFMPTYGDISNGLVTVFLGSVSDITVGRTSAQITAKDPRELLNMQLPRNLYQTNCVRALYDAGCTLSKPAFTTATTVTSGATTTVVGWSSIHPAGYYDLGTLVFSSGANVGMSRTIKSWDGTHATLFYPLPVSPATSDGINVAPGCDRTSGAGGCAKFNNLVHFAGTPYVPVAETAH